METNPKAKFYRFKKTGKVMGKTEILLKVLPNVKDKTKLKKFIKFGKVGQAINIKSGRNNDRLIRIKSNKNIRKERGMGQKVAPMGKKNKVKGKCSSCHKKLYQYSTPENTWAIIKGKKICRGCAEKKNKKVTEKIRKKLKKTIRKEKVKKVKTTKKVNYQGFKEFIKINGKDYLIGGTACIYKNKSKAKKELKNYPKKFHAKLIMKNGLYGLYIRVQKGSQDHDRLLKKQKKVKKVKATRKKSGKRKQRLTITIQHGESKSLFYVVDANAPESEQPAVVKTFHDHEDAEAYIAKMKKKGKSNPDKIILELPKNGKRPEDMRVIETTVKGKDFYLVQSNRTGKQWITLAEHRDKDLAIDDANNWY